MNKPYDPKLREAAEEFKAVCKKYDCMGVVLFVSPSHAEFVYELSPSWSVIKVKEEGIEFRMKKEHFKDMAKREANIESTVHGVTSVVNWASQTVSVWSGILLELRKHMAILYSVWGKPDSVPGDGL